MSDVMSLDPVRDNETRVRGLGEIRRWHRFPKPVGDWECGTAPAGNTRLSCPRCAGTCFRIGIDAARPGRRSERGCVFPPLRCEPP